MSDAKWSRADNGMWWRRIGDYVQMIGGGDEPPPDNWAPPAPVIVASFEYTYETPPDDER
jgi:hypothetical protein